MPLKTCWRRHAQCQAYSQLAVAWQWPLPSSQASSFKFWTLDRGTGLQFPPLEHLTRLYNVYDSLYSCAGTHLKAHIAAVMATWKPELVLEFMNVPIQSGSYDCGLFAIAFATALALGEKPELFFFDQWNMRAQCFEDGEMKMFPVLRKRRVKKSAVKTTEEVQVYCKCRMPELPGEQLIECTNCKEWYHLDTYIAVPPTTCLDSSVPWFCHKCL